MALANVKIVICMFCHGYAKSKYGEKAKLHYVNTDSFIVYVKTKDILVDIAEDVGRRFDTSNYDLERPLARGKN